MGTLDARLTTGTGCVSGVYQAKNLCGPGRLYIGKISCLFQWKDFFGGQYY